MLREIFVLVINIIYQLIMLLIDDNYYHYFLVNSINYLMKWIIRHYQYSFILFYKKNTLYKNYDSL